MEHIDNTHVACAVVECRTWNKSGRKAKSVRPLRPKPRPAFADSSCFLNSTAWAFSCKYDRAKHELQQASTRLRNRKTRDTYQVESNSTRQTLAATCFCFHARKDSSVTGVSLPPCFAARFARCEFGNKERKMVSKKKQQTKKKKK